MSNEMGNMVGFIENSYDTKTLKVSKPDVDLLMGRESEQFD